MRGRETVSRWAHNPKIGGSTPSSATNLLFVPFIGMSSNGRTTASDAVCLGSSPSVPKSNITVCRGDGMVDMLGLEPSAQRCAGSSPVPGN